jgi:hypothetical protein
VSAAVSAAAPEHRQGPAVGREAGPPGTVALRCGAQWCPVTPKLDPRAEQSKCPYSRARHSPHIAAHPAAERSCGEPGPDPQAELWPDSGKPASSRVRLGTRLSSVEH